MRLKKHPSPIVRTPESLNREGGRTRSARFR